MAADEWVVRAFSHTLQNVSPAALAFEAGSEEKLWTYKPLDLQQPGRKCMDAATHDRPNTHQENHSTFSAQLKAFIPVVIMLVTVRHSQTCTVYAGKYHTFEQHIQKNHAGTWLDECAILAMVKTATCSQPENAS